MSVWSQVQGTGAQTGSHGVTSLSASFVSAVASGDLVCTGCANFSYSSFSTSVSDNKSNSYTVDTGVTVSSSDYSAIAHSVVPTGGTSFTVTWNVNPGTNNYVCICIDEFSAPGATITVDNVINSNLVAGSTTPSVGTLAVSGNDLIYAVLLNPGSTTTITPGSGFTASYNVPGSSGNAEGICAEYKLNQASNINPGWTASVSGNYDVCGVAFKATGSARGLFMSATLSLGAGGSFFQSGANA